MYFWRLGAAFILIAVGTPAVAQTSPEEIRQMLGGAVNVEQGALLTATRASLKDLCGTTSKYEMHASIISRLEYGSLDPTQREAFRKIVEGQQRSNQAIFEEMDNDNREAFCTGLNRTITSIAARFVTAHPHLFTTTPTAPAKTSTDTAVREQLNKLLSQHLPAHRLYVFKLTENMAFEDARSISQNTKSPSDVTWVAKVVSIEMMLLSHAMEEEFSDIAALYKQRGEIIARRVRGEIDTSVMESLENENAGQLASAYKKRFSELKASTKEPAGGTATLQAVAKEVTRIIIGTAKYHSVAK
ncbi:hypothetical protein ACO2JO_18470 [Leptospira interrogans]